MPSDAMICPERLAVCLLNITVKRTAAAGKQAHSICCYMQCLILMVAGPVAGVIKFTSHNPASVVPLVPGDLVVNVTLAATLATPLMPGTACPSAVH